jgi:hypothetical protein
MIIRNVRVVLLNVLIAKVVITARYAQVGIIWKEIGIESTQEDACLVQRKIIVRNAMKKVIGAGSVFLGVHFGG